MNWDILPDDIIKLILKFRKLNTCGNNCATKIQSIWRCYKTRVLIGRYKLLRYMPVFRNFNPNVFIFISRSKL